MGDKSQVRRFGRGETTMTTQSITSTAQQGKQFKRFVEDAGDKALAEVTPDKDGLQRLIMRGGEFQAYLVEGVRRFTAKQPDYSLAQSILGVDFITPEEIMKVAAVIYEDKHLDALHNTIPSEDVLRWCKEHNYAVLAAPSYPINLLNIRMLDSNLFYSKSGGWYSQEKFASDNKTAQGWLLIRKDPVPESTSKNWNEQNKLLSGVESVPNSAEVSWLVTIYFKVRGIHLFEKVWVRCSDLDSDGSRVYVGYFDAKGLYVDSHWDGNRSDNLGLASARK